MTPLAARTTRITPFYVMEVVKEAARLQASGRSIIHMSIGEPDFTAPPAVRQAAEAALAQGQTAYTAALGLDDLRLKIAAHYREAFGVTIDAERVVVTAGASAALLLSMAALIERDNEVLMPDPSYPCNRHFVSAFDGRAVLLPCGPQHRFQLTAEAVDQAWNANTRGVLLASPSNPTGTSIAPDALDALLRTVRRRGGFAIVDEIYLGLSYDRAPRSALVLDDDAIIINSFSKYFSMTGWRLGWLIAPRALVPVFEKLAQNLFICASTVAQRAALACFEEPTLALCEARRRELQQRRDYLVPALEQMGLRVPVLPDGAFYIYADVSAHAADSWDFAFDLLRNTGVCLVPGRDFGMNAPERYVRLSYATALPLLREAMDRMAAYRRSRQRA
jgi:aspartate/methionine/tyrosine aminotransferase